MHRSLSSIVNVPVAEHEVVAFYPVDGIDFSRGPQTTFRDLAPEGNLDVLPSDQREALTGRYADQPIWRQAEPDDGGNTIFRLGEDLHPHIRDILSGARVDLATRWVPTEHATKLVTRADLYEDHVAKESRRRKSIALSYTKSAERRLVGAGAPLRALQLKVDAFDLVLFGTGKGLLQLRLSFSPFDGKADATAIELLEAVYSLPRLDSFRWVSAKADDPPVASNFTMGALMHRLCAGGTGACRPPRRLYTHLFARFPEPFAVDDADLFALYAARHYTTDYDVVSSIEGVRRVRDFATVGHAVALEGAATVIAPTSPGVLPESLKTWKTNVHIANYLPILILALHEHGFLVDKTSQALLTADERANSQRVQQVFVNLTRASLEFRNFFRFTEVSKVTMHNTFNRALRDVLGLDRMQAEFGSDIAEMSALAEHQFDRERIEAEHQRDTRFWFLGTVGTGILAGLSVSAFVKQGFDSRELFAKALTLPLHKVVELPNGPNFLSFLIGLIVLFGTCFLGYLNRPSKAAGLVKHKHHGFVAEAGAETIIHGMRE